MRSLLTALLVLSWCAVCRAADDARPNTLTPKEIAEGWILLFDGETNVGWAPASEVRADKGLLLLGGERRTTPGPTTHFTNYELRFKYRVPKGNDREFVRMKGDAFGRFDHELPVPKGNDWYAVRCVIERKKYDLWISNQGKELRHYWNDRSSTAPDRIGFPLHEGVQLALRDIKLKPLKRKPIFNGKDLNGWKKFEGDAKRAKSQFAVTEEGWLSIRNGPGDLQTTGEWADFVLQLDCRTDGDNLNSGVFFRCIRGEYQNGYEAQIQNQKAREPKAYTLEEYDANTHTLKGKRKIVNWSQDYGTGSIYRRVPARRSVARDREWFTLTILAQGRHLATWVNGIQVVDWTDNRPVNENARKGCRLTKGPISLQGHDPTTRLTFRNLHIANLKEDNEPPSHGARKEK